MSLTRSNYECQNEAVALWNDAAVKIWNDPNVNVKILPLMSTAMLPKNHSECDLSQISYSIEIHR